MNKRTLLILLCVGLFPVLLADQVGVAKTIQGETSRANNGSSSGVALELSWEGAEPFFNEVPGTGASHSNWKPPMVSTYKGKHAQLGFWYGLEGQAVRVTMNLFYIDSGITIESISDLERNLRGLQPTNSALNVSYLLQPGQRIDVTYFSEYGVKPFEIKIVKVTPVNPALPSFSSCTDVIQLISTDRLEGEFPSFRFTVKNVGSRRIIHLRGEAGTRIGWMTGYERPVAEPGQQFTIEIGSGNGGRLTGDAYRPDTYTSLEVTCAVFDDGNFAGDREHAFNVLHSGICNRLTMELLVRLFNERIESGATDLGDLRSKILSVCKRVGQDEMRELSARFPESARSSEMLSCARYSNFMAEGLLELIAAFEVDHSQSPTKEQTIDFLKSLRDPYLRSLSWWKPPSN